MDSPFELHHEILAAKADTLKKIGASRPQWDPSVDAYVCAHCGSSGDEGFAAWHDVTPCKRCASAACLCNDWDPKKRCCAECKGGHRG